MLPLLFDKFIGYKILHFALNYIYSSSADCDSCERFFLMYYSSTNSQYSYMDDGC